MNTNALQWPSKHQETYFPCMTMEGINEWPQIRSLWLPPSPSGISEFWHPTNYDNIYYNECHLCLTKRNTVKINEIQLTKQIKYS